MNPIEESTTDLPAELEDYMVFIAHDEHGVTICTEGMYTFDLPELVLEGVSPRCLASAAADLVKDVAEYMIVTQRELRPGQTILLGPDTILRFSALPDEERGHVRWALEDVPDVFCPECEGGDHEIYVPPWRRGAPN